MKLKFFIISLVITTTALAEFDMLSKRYITAYDFQNRLKGLFSVPFSRVNVDALGSCFRDMDKLGLSNPITGKALSQQPNSTTVELIKGCMNQSFAAMENAFTQETLVEYKASFAPFVPETILNNIQSTVWHYDVFKSLSSADQEAIISQTVETFLGIDEVIISYGVIKNPNEYRAFLKEKLQMSNLRITEAIKSISIDLALRDEFLTY